MDSPDGVGVKRPNVSAPETSSTPAGPTWIDDVIAVWDGSARCAMRTFDREVSGPELMSRAARAATEIGRLVEGDGAVIPALVDCSVTGLSYTLAGASARRPLLLLGTRLAAQEIAHCVAATSAEVMICEPQHQELASAAAGVVAQLRGGRPVRVHVVSEPATSDDALERCAAEDIAVVLHTSGTTGHPKLVAYRQDRLSLRGRLNAMAMELDIDDRVATASPFHHLGGFGLCAVALGSGASVLALPKFGQNTWRQAQEGEATHTFLVPAMVEDLAGHDLHVGRRLKMLHYGASRIRYETLVALREALPGIGFVQTYGQTEGSPISALTREDHELAADYPDLLRSAGRPVRGVEMRVDEAQHEVVVRAPHLFAPGDDGWLWTGDVGDLRDGYLFLNGRTNDMFVRGGENVNPVEIERVVAELSGVVDVAVVGVADDRVGARPVAFVVLDDRAAPSAAALRDHARRFLSGFKVPTEWHVVDELPRTATGKVQRHRLVAQAADGSETTTHAPLTTHPTA